MKKIVLYFIITFFFCSVYGQKSKHFAQDLPFSSEVYKTTYLQLSDSILSSNNLRNQIKLSQQLYELTKIEKDTLRLIFATHNFARRLQYAGEHLNALPLYKEELNLLSKFKPNPNELIVIDNVQYLKPIEVLCQLGNCFSSLSEYDLAFEYFHKALDIANKENYSFYRAVIPSLIGTLKFATDDYDEALNYYNKSLADLKFADIDSLNIKFNSGLISIYKGQVYLKKKLLDSAQYVIEDAEKKGFFSVGYLSKTGYEISKAEFLLEEGKSTEALELLLKTKTLIDTQDPKFGILTYYFLLSKAYFKEDNLDAAIRIMNNGLEIKKTRFSEMFFTEDYKFLAEVYKAKGNLEKSNYFLEKYVLNQSAIDKSKKEIIDLFHEKEIRELQDEKQSQQKFTKYLIASGGSIIVALLFFLLKFFKKRKKDEAKFKQLHNKIKGLTSTKTSVIDTKESKEVLEEKSTDVPRETVLQILSGLKKIEEQEYFLKQDCNSYNVAKKIKTNTSYLSKVINSEYQKNFNTYINDLRINYAIVKIENDRMFRSYSIQSIAEELGYKSADSFTKYFKRRTGLNPSFYIKKLKNL